LWQGVNGINNPCPTGYRLPTYSELNAELASWSPNNATGAFASPLKLPNAGRRHRLGNIFQSSYGYYWSSTISGTVSWFLFFSPNIVFLPAYLEDGHRAHGHSVRCIKN
jgi:hypothetical protein